MKLQKTVGLFIIAISILIFSLQISIGNLAKYIDQTTGQYWSADYEYKYIPSVTYILFIIAIMIGLYLIFKCSKNN